VFTPSTLHPHAMEVLVEECAVKGATLHVVDTSDPSGASGGNLMSRENRLLSEAVCRYLDVNVEGMREFYWPCR
jgi:hypothetical protein